MVQLNVTISTLEQSTVNYFYELKGAFIKGNSDTKVKVLLGGRTVCLIPHARDSVKLNKL